MLCSTARSSHGSRRRRPSQITSATRRPSYHMHAFPAHRHGTMIAILTTSKPPTNRKQIHTLYKNSLRPNIYELRTKMCRVLK